VDAFKGRASLTEEVNGEARWGTLSALVSKGRMMGFGHKKPGCNRIVAVLTKLGSEV